MNFSSFQLAIFDYIANGKGSLVVNAVAGSGKTTTIVECAKRANKRDTLFLAFNKSIVNELSGRMGNSATCTTLHACGLDAIRKAFGKVNIDAKGNYWYSRALAFTQDKLGDVSELLSIVNNALKIFNLCRLELLTHTDIEAIRALAEHHNLECDSFTLQVVSYLLSTAYEIRLVGNTAQVDFTDMIVLPNLNPIVKRSVSKHSLVFIDEAQDLSSAQRGLMLLSVAKGGRFVAVGDPRQAINGFAGANNDSFAQLAKLANKELPLSCNYRCGSDIINLAQSIVPNIVAHAGAEKGVIRNVTDLTDLELGDMVLCRKSAPLVRIALKCLANNIRANVMGRDIAQGLVSLIKKAKVKRIDTLLNYLDTEVKKAENKHKANPQVMSASKLEALKDKVNAINAISENINMVSNNGIQALLNKIDYLFTDDNNKANRITFATCHKSKGLENERIFILVPDKLPLVWKGQKEWQYEQEMNLKYVAITRAKKELIWVNVEEDKLPNIKIR